MADREVIAKVVEANWEALNSQGWRNANSAIVHYMSKPDELERDLQLAERVRRAKHPEEDRAQGPTGDPSLAAWVDGGKEIQQMAALGMTPDQIQERARTPDGEVWSMTTIDLWAATPQGKVPNMRMRKLMPGFGR